MLTGPRLLLRGVRREDLPALNAFANDFEVASLGDGGPAMPLSLQRMQAEWDASATKGGRDGAWFAIEADGKVIGQCGLYGFDQFQHTTHHAELGIIIGDKTYWGRGYGREAIGLVLDYGFESWNLHRIWLETSSDNERGQRCYRACGFVEEGRLREHEWKRGRYVDTVVMGILRGEWEQMRQSQRA
jgi:RimJ/RimL family protein N-acetyltransferase